MALLAGLCAPLLAMHLVVRRTLPGTNSGAVLGRAGITIALSLGVSSVIYFVARLLQTPIELYGAVDVLAFGMLAVVASRLKPSRNQGSLAPPTRLAGGTRTAALTAVLTVVILIAGGIVVRERFLAIPNGEWDAWAIWNLRAAFLVSPTSHWSDGFTEELRWSHPDYPLLVPASIARLWHFAGSESPLAPMLFATAVMVATALVLTGSLIGVSYLAAALGIALLLVPEYLLWVTSQCADAPMGLFVLASVVLLSRGEEARAVALAGIAAGFAAWTKNEGTVAALSIAVSYAAVSLVRQAAPVAVRRIVWFWSGLSSSALVLFVFSSTVAPSSDLAAAIVDADTIAKFSSFERHSKVVAELAQIFVNWGRWSLATPTVLAVAFLAMGYRRPARLGDAVWVGTGTLALMVVAYYLVFMSTPYDVEWHIYTSWSRLIAQLWPTLVWTSVSAAMTSTTARA
jgi:hypothetical protein